MDFPLRHYLLFCGCICQVFDHAAEQSHLQEQTMLSTSLSFHDYSTVSVGDDEGTTRAEAEPGSSDGGEL